MSRVTIKRFFGVHAPDSPACTHVDTETNTSLLILGWESLEIFQSVQENFVWRNGTDSSHLWKLRANSSHLRKKSNQSFADDTNTYQFFTTKMRKMWNLSTDVRPQKLSKLTIRKFHIFQKWRFGTNSSNGVKFAKC